MNMQQDDLDPAEMNPAWLNSHEKQAAMEGWGIVNTSGSDNGPWQIQRLDDASDLIGATQLDSDDQAWVAVMTGREPHHVAAIEFIHQHNTIEYEAMMEHAEKEEIIVNHVPGFSKKPA